ncbi:glycosyl hydrolase [Nibricoccus aquaticus]|uniref:Glycosyl hydrolase n=1 Tax=Nibricoccus aquaticus TaxID=2576891 RepID=A0A290QFU2_9BACT|nr:glycoside hydrolase family 3 C-terminal domain-containing protein [Nibricoccus aquaticus]ATC66110.1 glycosyl hydrolase [Nibricoccus aquaticus]
MPTEPSFRPPVSFEDATTRADALLAKLSLDEKHQLISGHRGFFTKGFPHHGIPELLMSDASGGVNLRRNLGLPLDRSVAFPAPIALAATWNPALAARYARAIGEECRAANVAILLGPGVNIYRHSQCGRNFEYFGEDPFLAAQITERYVLGVLETGTIPTLKHFLANNTDHHRRTSDSALDERTMHEIYLPAFKAGIDAGAMAVMTAYNQVNGEWAGQSRAVIEKLLRETLGYQWLVMTDWWSVFDAEKIIASGQDLEMPGEKFLQADTPRLLKTGRVTEAQIDRLVRSILRTQIAMGLHDRPVHEPYYAERFPEHEQVALQTARESIVLLTNRDAILPLRRGSAKKILLTGLFTDTLARGGGSAEVEGYNHVQLRDALTAVYGDALTVLENPTDADLRSADAVFLSTGTHDSEGWDRPFALPDAEEQRILRAVSLNPRTIVLVNTGSGIRMTAWADRAAAIVYAWYPGQNGNRALAEILCGDTAPSGKLPFTIEREFTDSPGANYLPPGEQLYTGWDPDNDMSRPINRIPYTEGILVGYRWYEAKKIAPLFPFGHGLTYTTFEYSQLSITPDKLRLPDGRISIEFTVTNTGPVAATEVAQLYLSALSPSVPRASKELRGFTRLTLQPGESRIARIRLVPKDFSFWDVTTHTWKAEPGPYKILIGGSSAQIALESSVSL